MARSLLRRIAMHTALAFYVTVAVQPDGQVPTYPSLQPASGLEIAVKKAGILIGATFSDPSGPRELGPMRSTGVGKYIVEEGALPILEPIFDIGDMVQEKSMEFREDFEKYWYQDFLSQGLCFEHPCYVLLSVCDAWRPCREVFQWHQPRSTDSWFGRKCVGHHVEGSTMTRIVSNPKWPGSYVRLCNAEGVKKLFTNYCYPNMSYLGPSDEALPLRFACLAHAYAFFGIPPRQHNHFGYKDLVSDLKESSIIKPMDLHEAMSALSQDPQVLQIFGFVVRKDLEDPSESLQTGEAETTAPKDFVQPEAPSTEDKQDDCENRRAAAESVGNGFINPGLPLNEDVQQFVADPYLQQAAVYLLILVFFVCYVFVFICGGKGKPWQHLEQFQQQDRQEGQKEFS